jgi:uncharacterized repeat protein (TIGR03803 family)
MLRYTLAMALAIIAPCSAAIEPAVTPPKLTTLYSFPGTPGGGFLEAGLILSPSGVLYGTTAEGGANGWGSVYQLTPGTGGAWVQKVLYSFNPLGSTHDGASPQASLVLGTSGVLYGTTTYGGTSDDGTVFSLTPPASGGSWTEKVIHNFTGGADGAQPEAALSLVPTTQVLFGTTYAGGTSTTCNGGCGTVFEMTPSTGGSWTERVIYSFTGGVDGGNPVASLALAATQILYGTTYTGGKLGYGTVFSMTPPAKSGAPWTENVIYSFTNLKDGSGPEAGVVIKYEKVSGATINVLYGSTFWAGSSTGCLLGGYPAGCGTVFSLTPPTTSGAAWTFATLYTFTGTGNDGAHPSQTLSLNSGGVLYGTTFSGGSTSDSCFGASYQGCGTVFLLKPPGGPGVWAESILHDFDGDDGGGPNGVIAGPTGGYYGATYNGGTSGGYGTVFQLTPQPQ